MEEPKLQTVEEVDPSTISDDSLERDIDEILD